MTRDMTKREFDSACARYGFKPCGFMGYYSLADAPVNVSILNAGKHRRAQLAYLLREYEKAKKKWLKN